VQSLRIPVFGAAPKQTVRSLFSLRRKRPAQSAPAGCDPNLFADEISLYLARAAEERERVVAAAAVPAPVTPQGDFEQEPTEQEWTRPEPLAFAAAGEDAAAREPLTDTVLAASESIDVGTRETFDVAEPRDEIAPPPHAHDEPTYVRDQPLYVRDEPLYLHEGPLDVREVTTLFVEPVAPAEEPAPADVELSPAALEDPAIVEEAPADIEPAAYETTPAPMTRRPPGSS
jgi:hypothetical protein